MTRTWTEKSELRALAAVIALAVLARGAVLSRGFGTLDDPDRYLPLARSLVEGRGFALEGRPTAYRPPLYPIVLSPIVAATGGRVAWGVAVLHLALGAATVAMTAATARRWGRSRGRSLAAAAIVALDPVLVAQCRPVMTETLSAALVVAALLALTVAGRRGAALGGLAFGLGALCRPSLLPAAGLAALAAFRVGPGERGERLRRGMFLTATVAATLAPWAIRNARVFGEPVWTTTHGGYTLALANNAVYYEDVLHGPPGAVWSGPNQARWWADVDAKMAGLPEPEADRRFRALGLRMLSERPRDFARASLARLGRFWAVAPAGAVYSRSVRVVTAVWTIPLWLALAWGTTRRGVWQWPQIVAPIFVMTLAAVHLVYWTDLRMRAPIVPAIALIAASCPVPVVSRLSAGNDFDRAERKK